MNMRQQKRYLQNKLAWNNYFGLGLIRGTATPSPLWGAFKEGMELERKVMLAELVEAAPEAEEAKVEFVVVKKSTGEVVGTFDNNDDALALIDKHKRQKKAALELLAA